MQMLNGPQIENFEHIMPENIDKFEAGEESFLFALKGMPEIELKLQEVEAPKKIVLGSANEKFPFSLTADIEDNSPSSSNVQLLFDGKFNPMVAMAAKLTVVEVEEIVENGQLDPDQVHTPGIFVHRIVLNPNPEKRIEQRTVRPG